jgi:ketosteroid isomerase-like protein
MTGTTDTGAADAIWAAMPDVYAGALAGDRARVDAHLDPDCTFWDSHSMPLIHGLAELQPVRDSRPEPGAAPGSFEAVRPEVRVWGDTAVLLHLFTWFGGDGAVEFRARNTSVWRRDEQDGWRMVHNHEDVTAEGYWPV